MRNLSKAIGDRKWKDAMKMEMEVLEKNKAWELVKLPRERSWSDVDGFSW